MPERNITLSVVSHGQNALVNQLLEDIQRHCADRVSLVLTENIPDPAPLATSALPCPGERIANGRIKGFGANHNAAFAHCRTPYFCVVNPDIRLPSDPFAALLPALADARDAMARQGNLHPEQVVLHMPPALPEPVVQAPVDNCRRRDESVAEQQIAGANLAVRRTFRQRIERGVNVAMPGERKPRVLLHEAELDLELARMPDVVGIEKRDILPARRLPTRVARGRRTAIFRQSEDPQALRAEFLLQLRCAAAVRSPRSPARRRLPSCWC